MAILQVTQGKDTEEEFIKLNEAETASACDAVANLLRGGYCEPKYVSIVTTYSAQVRSLRRMTKNIVSRPPYVEVSSTEDFQGREKEALVAQIAIGVFETESFVSLNANEILVNEEGNGVFFGFIGNHSPLSTFLHGGLGIIN